MHKFYEEGIPIFSVVIWQSKNIQLIIMLQLQHYSDDFQLRN